MPEFYGGALGPKANIPDNVTLPQFMLDYAHPLRPKQGNIPCLIEDATGRRVSLAELKERTAAMATVLKEQYRIGDGEAVLLCSPNDVDYPVALWAITSLGGIFTGSNPSYTPSEIAYQLKITEATFIIAHSSTLDAALQAAKLAGLASDRIVTLDAPSSSSVVSLSPLVAAVISRGSVDFSKISVKLRPGEGKTRIAMLCMSSGTTGPPKAVAISHTALVANLVQMSALGQTDSPLLCPGDVVLAVLPFFHVAGLIVNLHWMLFCATTLVVVPKFDFVAMLESIARFRIQHLMLVPPIALALAKHPAVRKYDLSGLKFIGSGAAPMTSELQDQLKQLFPQARTGQAYGLTETATIVAMTPFHMQCSYGSVGYLVPGLRARVVKPDGSLAGYNEPGELLVNTPSLSLGYHKNKEATEEAYTSDGWFRTGDQVMVQENGEVWVTDRLKELIKVRGFQVSPAELEGLILDNPDVSDCCVVGAPDANSGEVPLAFVVLTADAEKRAKTDGAAIKASIQKLVSDNKIRYKHLAAVEFIPIIPKNASGKILRRVLTEQVKERAKAKL
ncbi:amp dependent CoA ligase [Mycena amicta]|nr:amp dependent CoA ligase [Mycena amicta]